MNREQYMKLLKEQLRRLPKDDFEKAIAYYEEYFDEAGVENEQQAIEDLGSPQEAAGQIICDIAVNNTKETSGGMKKKINAVWVGLLAVFAAPIALPILLGLLALLVVLVLLAVVAVVCAFAACVSIILTGPVSIIGGLTILTKDIASGLCCLGFGLVGIGAGVLLVYVLYHLCRFLVNKLILVFGQIAKKGEKKHE